MKNRIIALALVIVMLFALSACARKQAPAPAPTEQPAAPTEAPVETTPEPTPEPAPEPEPTPELSAGIPEGSGVVTYTSKTQGFSIDFDSDAYVANELPNGSIRINAGDDEGIPFCTVTLTEKEIAGQANATNASGFIFDQAKAVVTEQGDAIVKAPAELASPIEGRNLVGFSYTFNNEEAGGEVWNIFYAEDLENGKIAVYSSSALEADMSNVNAIMKLAMESFKLTA